MTDSNTPTSPRLSNVFRSNLLPTLAHWVRVATASDGTLLNIEVFSMVLDANKVIAEIRWRLSKRTKPHALTGIFESIEARVLVAYVPSYTEHEVFANAEELAREIGKSKEEVLEEWQRIKPFLRVHETAMQQVEVMELADPKDLVYMATQQQLGLSAIYSDDPHLQRMGAPLVKGRIDEDLRDYARGSAVTIGVSLGSGLVVSVTVPTVFRLLKSSLDWLLRQPLPFQLALAALLFALLRNPRVRFWLADKWKEYWPPLVELMTPILLEYCESQTKAISARNRIQQAIPAPTKRCSALKYCQGACPAGNSPLSLVEIRRGMRDAGYRSKSKDPASYLRTVMRRSGMFVELTEDRWIQLPPVDRFDHLREDSYVIRPVSDAKPRRAHLADSTNRKDHRMDF
jgi:hypothetical protein